MDGLAALYSPDWTKRFTFRARQRYGQLDDWETLVEDAISRTAMKLHEHGDIEGCSDAMIYTVFNNALTDTVRERNGFPRPRKWLEDLGEIGTALFKLICLKNYTRSEVADWVETQAQARGEIPGGAPSVATGQQLAQSIFDRMQAESECAAWRRHMAREGDAEGEGVSPLGTLSSTAANPEESAEFDQVRVFVAALVGASDELDGADEQRMRALADKTWDSLGLDDHDRLVVNAYLGRGLGGAQSTREANEKELAEDLGMSVGQIRNRRKRVLDAMLDIFVD